MQVQELLTPQIVTVRGERMAVPLTLPGKLHRAYLVTLTEEELTEVDRQNEIMKVRTNEVLACVFKWGFTSLTNLRLAPRY